MEEVPAGVGFDAPDDAQTILIVDDSPLNRALLADMVGDSYRIIEAEDGCQALSALQREGAGIALVLLDYVMPNMDGFAVLEAMNRTRLIEDIPVIMVSAEADASYSERAYELGVTDFITRPYNASIVRRRVLNTLMLHQKQRQLMGMVVDQVRERERSNNLMVCILSHIVEFRNGESGLHVMHVQAMTEMILTQLVSITDRYPLSAEDIRLISLASALHDIGKIVIPESILNKPGRLTAAEFETIKTHAAAGAAILGDLQAYKDEKLVRLGREICRWHHERYDGKGYPDGLKGEQIPISAQAVALADVYDALKSKRAYKEACTHEKALAMIHAGECGAFNPLLLESLDAIADTLEEGLDRAVAATDVSVGSLYSNATVGVAEMPSSQTLRLLDYERMKYHFYAAMSKEVQFEYVADTSIMTVSDWGDRKLGLPAIIVDPYDNEDFRAVFGEENITQLSHKLRDTTPESPLVDTEVKVTVDGEPRWLHAVIRAVWSKEDAAPHYEGSIGKFVDIDDLQTEIQDLQFKAYHDSLTQVANGHYVRKVVAERLRMEGRLENSAHRYVLALCDLDYFKSANDEFGHQFGDKVLQCFVKRLKGSVRSDDVVARVGGDEFLLCIECAASDDVRHLIKRVHGSLEGSCEGFPLRVSMGVSTTADGTWDYDELLRRADIALYHKKRSGRSGFVFYEDLSQEERESMFDGSFTALSSIDERSERAE